MTKYLKEVNAGTLAFLWGEAFQFWFVMVEEGTPPLAGQLDREHEVCDF